VEDIRHLKQLLDYRPIERKRPTERPLKRLLDEHSREMKTCNLLA